MVGMKLLTVTSIVIFYLSNSAFGENPLTISLFYESYCPDCQIFIRNQILGAWDKFKGQVRLDLIPFGNAEQRFIDGHWEFKCQHGPKECIGNKLHACAIRQACNNRQTVMCEADNVTKVVTFISCLESHDDQLQATSEVQLKSGKQGKAAERLCAKKSKLDANNIISCMKGIISDTLLNLYGNRTLEFTPRIQYVPTVAINGEHDAAAEDNLVDEICKLQPELCKHLYPEIIQV